MTSIVKYLCVLGFAVLFISAVSVIWPLIFSLKRPDALEKVHDIVIQTDFGKNMSNVLGLTTDVPPAPINISSAAASIASYVVTSVEKKAQDVVYQQILQQFFNQYQTMTPEKKKDIQDLICKPDQ